MIGYQRLLRRLAFCLLALVVSTPNAFALKGVEKVVQAEGITEYRLKNGLQVLLFPDPTKETVTVNITYHVGSKQENYGETGMAHLLEHLLFKGTPKHKDIPDELTKHGAKANGTTWLDRTNYYETFNATEENLRWALELEADRMVNSFIKKEHLDSEMTVVRNELERGENSPFRVLMQKMQAASYMWHNYGKSTIGAPSDLENVSIARLRKFYETYYQPDNATLIVAGKIDEEATLKLIKKYFGKLKKPKRTLPELYTQETASDGERTVTVRRVGDIQLVMASYHTPSNAHPDSAAIAVLSNIIGDNPTGRLYKNAVETGIASQIFAWDESLSDSGSFKAGAIVDKQKDLAAAEKVLIEQMESLTATPVTETELERAKRSIAKDFEKAMNNTESVAIGLSEWVTTGDWRLRFLQRDRIAAVTLEDVQRVAEAYFTQNNRVVGRFIPTEAPQRIALPQPESVASQLEGYVGNEDVSMGEAFDPSYENIAARTQTTTIADTIQVAMIPKKTRGESVRLNIQINYGTLDSLTNTQAYSGIVGQMLDKGTKNYTREQMKDQFDKLKTYAGYGSNTGSAWAWMETDKENLIPALRLLAEGLKHPVFPQAELDVIKSATKVSLEYSLQDPNTIAQTEASRRLLPVDKGHPHYSPTLQESIDSLSTYSRKDLLEYYERFFSANNMIVSIVGDVEPDVILKELETQFGDWKNDTPYEHIIEDYNAIDTSPAVFDTPDKENGIFLAVNLYEVQADHEDVPALILGNYVFGGGFINSRLATRLRQKEGWSYGAGASLSPSKLSPRAAFWGYAIGAPQNLDKIEQGFKEEMTRLLDDGFTKDEIENAKSGIVQRNHVSRSEDKNLIQMLTDQVFYKRSILEDKEFEDALLALTPEQVQKTMQKYFDPNNMLYIKAGDMTKAKMQAEKPSK